MGGAPLERDSAPVPPRSAARVLLVFAGGSETARTTAAVARSFEGTLAASPQLPNKHDQGKGLAPSSLPSASNPKDSSTPCEASKSSVIPTPSDGLRGLPSSSSFLKSMQIKFKKARVKALLAAIDDLDSELSATEGDGPHHGVVPIASAGNTSIPDTGRTPPTGPLH